MSKVKPSDYASISNVQFPRLSPNEESIIFLTKTPTSETTYETTLNIASVGGKTRTVEIQHKTISEPCWSPDGDQIAFIAEHAGSDELWITDRDGEERRLTSVAGDVTNITWSSDGTQIAFVQAVTEAEQAEGLDRNRSDEYTREEPDPRRISRLVYRSAGGYFDGATKQVYVIDVDSGDVSKVTGGQRDHDDLEWGESGVLYYSRWLDDATLNHAILRYDTATGQEERVAESHHWWDNTDNVAISRDGAIAHIHIPNDGDSWSLNQSEIIVVTDDKKTHVTADIDRTVVGGPYWGPEGEYVYFLVPDQGEVALKRVHRHRKDVEDVIAGHGNHIHDVDIGSKHIVLTQSLWNCPGDVYLHYRQTGETERMSTVNEEYIDRITISKPHEVWFDSDGTEIQGWVLYPPDFDKDQTYPAVLEIHGGPSIMWTESGSMWHEFQSLAAAGYIVVWTNPRGSSGYGQAHAKAIGKQFRPDFEDLMAATDKIASRPYVDENNLFVTGGSFGGFMTGWIVGHTNRFAAAVAQRGVYDQVGQYGTKDTFHATESRHGKPWENHEEFWINSPIAHVENVSTPTMLIHSENDFRCSVFNAEVFYRFLKRAGVDSELIRYPRETHELSRGGEPGHVVDRLETILDWFDRHSST